MDFGKEFYWSSIGMLVAQPLAYLLCVPLYWLNADSWAMLLMCGTFTIAGAIIGFEEGSRHYPLPSA